MDEKYVLLTSHEVYALYLAILEGASSIELLKTKTGKKKSAISQILKKLIKAKFVFIEEGTGVKNNPAIIKASAAALSRFFFSHLTHIEESKREEIIKELKLNSKINMDRIKFFLFVVKNFDELSNIDFYKSISDYLDSKTIYLY